MPENFDVVILERNSNRCWSGEAAEKGEFGRKKRAGAEARHSFAQFTARVNSRPDTKPSSEVASGEPPRNYEFLIPLAPTLDAAQRKVVLHRVEKLGGGLPVRMVDDARAALFHARASVVASGTATVEAALIGNPFVVVYRVSRLTYAIARRLVKVPHVAMANLIAGKRVVPELIQNDFTAANIVQYLRQLLPDGPARQSMMKELGAIREALHSHSAAGRGNELGAIETVAAIVSQEIEAAHPATIRSGGTVENSPGPGSPRAGPRPWGGA
jgi:lipid-A-disaccharide synthase